MTHKQERSQLKRPRNTLPDEETESKKPRRSDRLAHSNNTNTNTNTNANANASANNPDKTPVSHKQQLPSPVTNPAHDGSGDGDGDGNGAARHPKDPTATPPVAVAHEITPRKVSETLAQAQGQSQSLSSPPQDTQPLSQYVDRHPALSDDVIDEVKEGVWGYLVPLDPKYGDKPLVLKKRAACPPPGALSTSAAADGKDKADKADKTDKIDKPDKTDRADKTPLMRDGEAHSHNKPGAKHSPFPPSGGYLVGRHQECDVVVGEAVVSNRHCLLFAENVGHDTVAIVEDLSSNGTYVNEALVGRNQRRELEDQDEIAVHGKIRFIFRYPQSRHTSAFSQQYTLMNKLGKGHFAEVYMCLEKSTGKRYAVKIFTKHPGIEDRSKIEGLQHEIGVLMGVSHPNVLCLKDTFTERDRVYLVLELAAEGELFNHIVMKQKLGEDETRKLFKQLFDGIKYLHDRNIVHRDIKPENILLVDKNLYAKLADFGLAKIIGEESFTTTLCGTPSYVAPEILADSKHRKYSKAVDVWSLGVVLYICLCGFPPFSDELFSRDFPFSLSQQIRSGRFDYPSPYWDSVGDPALDLIDSMLVVDPDRRFTIDQCLKHPWLTQGSPSLEDSTCGLVIGIQGLEVKRRAPARERTLLASVNTVEVATQLDGGDHKAPVKVFSKNKQRVVNAPKEAGPAHQRAPEEFMELGGKGDQQLYPDEDSSVYPAGDIANKSKSKGKANGR